MSCPANAPAGSDPRWPGERPGRSDRGRADHRARRDAGTDSRSSGGLQKRSGMAMVFITLTSASVGRTPGPCRHAGEVVESGKTQEIFTRPCHSHTRLLLDAESALQTAGSRERAYPSGGAARGRPVSTAARIGRYRLFAAQGLNSASSARAAWEIHTGPNLNLLPCGGQVVFKGETISGRIGRPCVRSGETCNSFPGSFGS